VPAARKKFGGNTISKTTRTRNAQERSYLRLHFDKEGGKKGDGQTAKRDGKLACTKTACCKRPTAKARGGKEKKKASRR